MENVRLRMDVELLATSDSEPDLRRIRKLAKDPRLNKIHIFNENLVAIHRHSHTVCLEKPMHIGVCVLELAKYWMYEFHYGVVKRKYKDNARLLFTDTGNITEIILLTGWIS